MRFVPGGEINLLVIAPATMNLSSAPAGPNAPPDVTLPISPMGRKVLSSVPLGLKRTMIPSLLKIEHLGAACNQNLFIELRRNGICA